MARLQSGYIAPTDTHRSSGSSASCSAAFHSSSVILFQSFFDAPAFGSDFLSEDFFVDLEFFLEAAAST